MKVRIGFGLGVRTALNDERFGPFVERLEQLGYDSLWLSERLGGEGPDPVVAMAYAAARTTRLKFGTSVLVLPGRNLAVLAKELASLDRLSGGRLLPAFGLGVADPHEQQAFGVARGERAGWFDEALPLLRRLWAEDRVTHHGDRFHYDDVRVLPKPRQSSIDVWLGGIAPSELRRCGRLGDGWLPSFVTPEDTAAGIEAIRQEADRHGRTIDPEHFGALIPYALDALPEAARAALATRRPDVDPHRIVPIGLPAICEQIQAFVATGTSKFVLIPMQEPPDWHEHLEEIATSVLPLQRAA